MTLVDTQNRLLKKLEEVRRGAVSSQDSEYDGLGREVYAKLNADKEFDLVVLGRFVRSIKFWQGAIYGVEMAISSVKYTITDLINEEGKVSE